MPGTALPAENVVPQLDRERPQRQHVAVVPPGRLRADPEWYLPRTATDAVPPVFAVDRVAPAGARPIAAPVSSREDSSSVPMESARPPGREPAA